MDPLLEVRNLNLTFKTYLGEVQALRDISFSLYPGEVVALVGESGCGKSATAQAIMGLIPSPPGFIKSGEILFQKEDLLKKSKRELATIRGKSMGMIFQDPMTSLNPTRRIGKQIIEGLLKHHDISKKAAIDKAIEMLSLVGIREPEKRFFHYPHQFSGGMRQRVMIAIALIHNPQLLIADEPTTALDVTIAAQIIELMKQLQERSRSTILLITHDLGLVAGIASRVLVMYGGKIMEIGSVDEIYKNPLHPYTQGLLRSVPRLDMDKNEALIPILGAPPSLLNPPPGCPFAARCAFAMPLCSKEFPCPKEPKRDHVVSCHLISEKGLCQKEILSKIPKEEIERQKEPV